MEFKITQLEQVIQQRQTLNYDTLVLEHQHLQGNVKAADRDNQVVPNQPEKEGFVYENHDQQCNGNKHY